MEGHISELTQRYQRREQLGASVALAWDTQLDRPVVLKRFRSTQRRALRVRRLLDVQPHPNLAVVRHQLDDGDERLLVMDWVDGTPLSQRLVEDPRPSRAEVDQWCADVAAALDHLHQQRPSFAHGDVKAANVVLTQAGAVLVDVAVGPRVSVWSDRHRLRVLRRRLLRQAGVPLLVVEQRRLLAGAIGFLIACATALVVPSRPTDRPSAAQTQRPVRAAPSTPADFVAAAPVVEAVQTNNSEADPTVEPPSVTAPTIARSRLAVYERNADPIRQWSLEWPTFTNVFRLDAGATPRRQTRTYGLGPIWTDGATLGEDWLLFYSALDGSAGTAPVEPDGHVGVGDYRPHPGGGFTHVEGDGNGTALLYKTHTGETLSMHCVHGFSCTSHAHALDRGYEHVTALGPGRFLLYDTGAGRAEIVTVAGRALERRAVKLPAGLSVVARSGAGFLVGMRSDGNGQLFSVAGVIPTAIRSFALGGSGWDAGVGFDRGFVVYRLAGLEAVVVSLDDAGVVRAAQPWKVPLAPIIIAIEPGGSI